MPNPYHFRARIDRLWRTANSSRPGYIQLKALDTVAREIYPATSTTPPSRSPLPPPAAGGDVS